MSTFFKISWMSEIAKDLIKRRINISCFDLNLTPNVCLAAVWSRNQSCSFASVLEFLISNLSQVRHMTTEGSFRIREENLHLLQKLLIKLQVWSYRMTSRTMKKPGKYQLRFLIVSMHCRCSISSRKQDKKKIEGSRKIFSLRSTLWAKQAFLLRTKTFPSFCWNNRSTVFKKIFCCVCLSSAITEEQTKKREITLLECRCSWEGRQEVQRIRGYNKRAASETLLKASAVYPQITNFHSEETKKKSLHETIIDWNLEMAENKKVQ